jgi:hypothetical protein
VRSHQLVDWRRGAHTGWGGRVSGGAWRACARRHGDLAAHLLTHCSVCHGLPLYCPSLCHGLPLYCRSRAPAGA